MQLTAASVQQLTVLQNLQPVARLEQATTPTAKNIVNRSYLDSRSNFSIVAKSENSIWYWGLLGSVNIQEKKKSIKRLDCLDNDRKEFDSDEKVVTIRPSFLRYNFHLSFDMGFRFVPRTLRIYHTLDRTAPIFEYVRDGDFSALQLGLQDGSASPFVSDQSGWTLLHVHSPANSQKPSIISLTTPSMLQTIAVQRCANS